MKLMLSDFVRVTSIAADDPNQVRVVIESAHSCDPSQTRAVIVN